MARKKNTQKKIKSSKKRSSAEALQKKHSKIPPVSLVSTFAEPDKDNGTGLKPVEPKDTKNKDIETTAEVITDKNVKTKKPPTEEKEQSAKKQNSDQIKQIKKHKSGTFLDYNAKKLPESYDEDKLTILVRDPEFIFVYWDLAKKTSKSKQMPVHDFLAGKLILKIYKSFDSDITAQTGILHREILLSENADSKYVKVDESYKYYIATLEASGFMESKTLATSNIVDIPISSRASSTNREWKAVEELYKKLRNVLKKDDGIPVQSNTVKESKSAEQRNTTFVPAVFTGKEKIHTATNKWLQTQSANQPDSQPKTGKAAISHLFMDNNLQESGDRQLPQVNMTEKIKNIFSGLTLKQTYQIEKPLIPLPAFRDIRNTGQRLQKTRLIFAKKTKAYTSCFK